MSQNIPAITEQRSINARMIERRIEANEDF